MKDGEPWFVAKDISGILGYENSRTMTRRLDEDEKDTQKTSTPSGKQEMTIINESGLYQLLFNFHPEQARYKEGGAHVATSHIEERLNRLKRFKRWVIDTVLSSYQPL